MIVPVCKRKGGVHDPGKHRGITLLSLVVKVLEDGRIMRIVECEMGEEQQGFRRGTADGIFTLRQLAERGWRDKRMIPFTISAFLI